MNQKKPATSFKVDLKPFNLSGSLIRNGLNEALITSATPFEPGIKRLALHNLNKENERSIAASTILERGNPINGEKFGILFLLALLENQKSIPSWCRDFYLICEDILVVSNFGRKRDVIPYAMWRKLHKEWIIRFIHRSDVHSFNVRLVRLHKTRSRAPETKKRNPYKRYHYKKTN